MGVDAEVLILGPFREVAERGKEAITNAQDVHDDDAENERAKYMLKAAQAVAKEGERALKRLQPLWDGQVGKYGATFTDALIQNGIQYSSLLFCQNTARPMLMCSR